MTGLTYSKPKARLIYAAVLVGSLAACKTGGGGSAGDNTLEPVTACLNNFTGALGELPILSALALDNLSLDQLTTVTNSLGSLTALPLTSLGDLLSAVDAGAISEVLAGCALQDALAGSDITSPSQLPAGPLTDLITSLLPFDLDGLLDLNGILAGLGDLGPNSLGDLLSGLQGGSILPADLADLFLGGLAGAGLPGPLQSVADLAAPGLAAVLDLLGGGLPGGLDSLLPADLLDIVNGVSDSNSSGSTNPLAAVLGGLTGALSGDAASALTDSVLGGLIGGAPDLFANGLTEVLALLDGGLPGGLDSLPLASVLDLSNALNLANDQGSTNPLSGVLDTITSGLGGDAASALTDTVLGSVIGGAPDLFANGLSDVLALVGGGLPGGLDSLPLADILDLADALNLSNGQGSTDPLAGVLGAITSGLSGDAASALTDTVLGTVIGGAPDLFADGLAGLLGELGTQLPNGLADLPAADILDLANALNAGNLANSTAPVTDVLSGIAGGALDAGAITSVLDTVLGLLGGLGA